MSTGQTLQIKQCSLMKKVLQALTPRQYPMRQVRTYLPGRPGMLGAGGTDVVVGGELDATGK